MTPRPRWGGLYVRMLVAAAAGVVTALAPLGPVLRTSLGCAVVVLAGISALGWLSANAPAFDQAEWCDCAARAMTIRVVAATPRRRRRRRRRGATLAV